MAVISLRGLTKHFDGDVRAVEDVYLDTEEGEYLVLLGPSGCGKTTLLRTIAGLEEPTAGQVHIGGQLVNGLPPRARKIAMVFQSYALYPHKTVRANIVFPLKAEKMDPGQRSGKADWAAELLGITALLDRRPRQLSGGERQRVALARALVRDPSVFLLDEPLSNLDAKLRAAARDDLKSFQREIGTTTLYVTHDQVEAMGMGDRIAVMNEGRIRQIGAPTEVYADPADTFVATFLGSPPMNLLRRAETLLGFRPEHLLPKGVVGEAPDAVPFSFRVNRIEHLGSDRYLYGALEEAGDETKVISKLPSTVDAEVPVETASPFVVRRKDLRFFDPETGLRTEPREI